MKKTYLLMAMASIAGLALTSCSEDEPISENHGTAISFRPSMGTRATETTNANLKEINVASFMGNTPYFNTLTFNKGADGYFTSDPTYNWPGDNTSLTFYAYSPANPGGVITLGSDSKVMTGFSPASSIANQIDFITATATGNKDDNEATGVPLKFDHRLVQIEVRAKTDNTAYTYKVSGVRIGESVSKADFDFTTNNWSLGTDKAIYDETYATPVELGSVPASVMGEGGNLMLIPQQLTAWNPTSDASNSAKGAYLAIKLQINTVAGAQVYPFPSEGDCTWAAIPIDDNWEAGKKYVYNLDLTHGAGYVDPHDPDPGKPVLGGPIKFTVDVTDWVDSSSDLPMDTGKDKPAE
ncbi:MAG: fimbrillin family protein [Muribaculaceae bacterium]|nr:fimbrillin family protein [Muribaculaceae bacterium]